MRNFSFNIEFSVNFENTLNEVKYQLLDGINYFRTNSDILINELIQRCGKDSIRISLLNKNYPRVKSNKAIFKRQLLEESHKPRIHDFFVELNQFLFNSTGFWKSLSVNICRLTSASASSQQDSCWNGVTYIKY